MRERSRERDRERDREEEGREGERSVDAVVVVMEDVHHRGQSVTGEVSSKLVVSRTMNGRMQLRYHGQSRCCSCCIPI